MLSSPVTVLMFLLAALAAASCRAAAPSTQPGPSTPPPPATLQATMTIAHTGNAWSAEITWTNPTDHGLSIGHYLSFSVSRTDVTPPTVVAASPEHAMTPHFRILLPAHESRKSSLRFWDKPEALPAGTYQLTIVFPGNMVASPLEQRFTVPAAATAPAGQ